MPRPNPNPNPSPDHDDPVSPLRVLTKARAHASVQKMEALLVHAKKDDLVERPPSVADSPAPSHIIKPTWTWRRRARDADDADGQSESAAIQLRALRRQHSETLAEHAKCAQAPQSP